jgi:signal transduction histidine kinase
MTRPLENLSRITNRISGGDYSVRADIKSDDEVGELADNFNVMAGSVEENVEELKDMIHRREQFVADFTHEMKTPMTTIIGYADSVRHLEMTEEERNMSLDYIYTEGKRLENLSQKLFDLLYLKNSDIIMEEYDASELAEETILHMKPMMNKKGITIRTDFEDGELYGDGELIKTVFINLLDNARKASRENSEITFTGKNLEQDGEKYYEFVVRDNGIGMSEEEQKKIFDEFFMADKSRTRKEGGAGLGMSLVAIILEKHGASIRIESELGKGTAVFTVWKQPDELEN